MIIRGNRWELNNSPALLGESGGTALGRLEVINVSRKTGSAGGREALNDCLIEVFGAIKLWCPSLRGGILANSVPPNLSKKIATKIGFWKFVQRSFDLVGWEDDKLSWSDGEVLWGFARFERFPPNNLFPVMFAYNGVILLQNVEFLSASVPEGCKSAVDAAIYIVEQSGGITIVAERPYDDPSVRLRLVGQRGVVRGLFEYLAEKL